MRIIIVIFSLILFKSYSFAAVADYIESYSDLNDSKTYQNFLNVIKGEASISDIEKQSMLDSELSQELNSPFIYTDLENCINIALDNNYEIKIRDKYIDEAFWQYKNSQFQLLPDVYYNLNIMNLSGQYLVGGIVTTTTHEVPIQSLAVVKWSTINQGKYFFLMAQTRNTLKAVRATFEYTKEQIIRDTVIAYYETLEKKLEIEVQKLIGI